MLNLKTTPTTEMKESLVVMVRPEWTIDDKNHDHAIHMRCDARPIRPDMTRFRPVITLCRTYAYGDPNVENKKFYEGHAGWDIWRSPDANNRTAVEPKVKAHSHYQTALEQLLDIAQTTVNSIIDSIEWAKSELNEDSVEYLDRLLCAGKPAYISEPKNAFLKVRGSMLHGWIPFSVTNDDVYYLHFCWDVKRATIGIVDMLDKILGELTELKATTDRMAELFQDDRSRLSSYIVKMNKNQYMYDPAIHNVFDLDDSDEDPYFDKLMACLV